MFTGLILGQGRFLGFRRGRSEMAVEAPGIAAKVARGDSVAVNGVCLTVTGADRGVLGFDLSRETLAKTTLGALGPGDRLNLELPLTLAAPLGGHLVSGHVDGVGRVTRTSARPPGKRLAISIPAALRPFLVAKGSVAVDGVSLTVAKLGPASFEVELVPATLAATNLGSLRGGARVNIECDMIGKYVYNWLSRSLP
ncbi:MAG TPA: riboflavin synthase [Candidatus Aminicenantes bacterium]|nr:riboflavin synthase [Candidatus Aminicenantes bacterium]HDT12957.1 riboflavin synthase [Candidatus Aminicenantes bacterium]